MSNQNIDGSCTDGLLGAMLGIREAALGHALPDEAIREMSTRAQVNVVNQQSFYDATLGHYHRQKEFWTNIGAPKNPGADFLESELILPADFHGRITSTLQSFQERTYGMPEIPRRRDFIRTVIPTLREMKAEIPNLPDYSRSYAHRYLDAQMNGGTFFNLSKGNQSSVAAMTTNALNNAVAMNPFIVVGNVFEVLPKTIAQYGIGPTFQAVSKMVSQSGGKFWREIPDLAKQGVYGHKGVGEKFKISPVDWTENPNKAIYYYAAEAAGKSGLEGVERLGFNWRPGNEPLWMIEHQSMNDLRLMRFTLGQTRLYAEWAANLTGGLLRIKEGRLAMGDFEAQRFIKGASALALFSALQSMQTGVDTAVPGILWSVLPEDQKDAILEMDNALPTNLLAKATGVRLGEKMQPVGGLAIGVGGAIATQDLAGIGRGAKETYAGITEGDMSSLTQGVIDMSVNSMMLAPSIKVGNYAEIGNANLKKLGAIVKDVVTGEISATPEDLGQDAINRFIAKQKL